MREAETMLPAAMVTRSSGLPSDHLSNLVRQYVCSLDVLAHCWIAGAAAAGGAIAQEFLSSRGAVNFAHVNISLGIDRHHVWPVKLACLAATATKATELCEVLPVDDIDCVIEEIGHVHATLLRVGREVHRPRRPADGLRSNVDLAHKTTFAHLSIRV